MSVTEITKHPKYRHAKPQVIEGGAPEFGKRKSALRKRWEPALDLMRGDVKATPKARESLSTFAELARAYGDSKHIARSEKRVDPDLRQELITEAQHIAKMADTLRQRCVDYEMYPLAYSLNEASSGLELAVALAQITEDELKP